MNQQQQQTQQDMMYGSTMVLPSERRDLLQSIEPDKIVHELFHRLQGEVFVNGEYIKDEDLAENSLTKAGAWDISTLMLSVSSQNVSISKLNDNEIRQRTLSIVKTTLANNLRRWKEYGIKSSDRLAYIKEIVFSNTFVTLKQPENEGIRNMIKNIGSGSIGTQEPEPMGVNTFRQ